jgi:hypothetical protein
MRHHTRPEAEDKVDLGNGAAVRVSADDLGWCLEVELNGLPVATTVMSPWELALVLDQEDETFQRDRIALLGRGAMVYFRVAEDWVGSASKSTLLGSLVRVQAE